MDPIKGKAAVRPLRRSIIFYITVFTLAALLLSGMTANLCKLEAQNIRNRYPTSGRKYYLTDENGNRMGGGENIGTTTEPLSEQDEFWLSVLEVLPVLATPVWSALCILAAAVLFYRNKLEKPLSQLRAASEKIAENDLDFQVQYEATDELGQLCGSFEVMRSTLAANFAEMWRQIEERKRLNAAFAHDLRTPLTVLKGYNEMLQASGDKQTQATAVTMQRHILRLEDYVNTMSRLHRLEDTQPVYQQMPLKALADSLHESGTILCGQAGKRFSMQSRIASPTLTLDGDLISQVHSNLVANAVRYAAASVMLCLEETTEGLLLSVSDDGPGFDNIGLEKAAEPYFTREKTDHFGLGLYTGKILCEHHGGWLRMENCSSGARVTAFFKGCQGV